jgi:hypothetical protein
MVDAIDPIHGNSSVQDIPDLPSIIPAVTPDDTVSLSIPAQAQILEQQGFSAVEIAAKLGVPANVVRDDLAVSPVARSAEVRATNEF